MRTAVDTQWSHHDKAVLAFLCVGASRLRGDPGVKGGDTLVDKDLEIGERDEMLLDITENMGRSRGDRIFLVKFQINLNVKAFVAFGLGVSEKKDGIVYEPATQSAAEPFSGEKVVDGHVRKVSVHSLVGEWRMQAGIVA